MSNLSKINRSLLYMNRLKLSKTPCSLTRREFCGRVKIVSHHNNLSAIFPPEVAAGLVQTLKRAWKEVKMFLGPGGKIMWHALGEADSEKRFKKRLEACLRRLGLEEEVKEKLEACLWGKEVAPGEEKKREETFFIISFLGMAAGVAVGYRLAGHWGLTLMAALGLALGCGFVGFTLSALLAEALSGKPPSPDD